ncbi:hypothetical protein BDP27DRAFT_1322310 [Rhodocollybia butyracea]|uniref:Uncharacterized protein n=1 Tax=Rhodocollybia butyracea TaxID=206335 RepID=A0A9P5PY01_9AGAR|nr:hypothetical protein BDP27DRAFT_1322310 [Rhodocollybia butyracea]
MTPAEQEQLFDAGFNSYVNVISVAVFAVAGGIATLGILIATWLLQAKTWGEPKAMQLLCCTAIWLCLIGQSFLIYIAVLDGIRFSFVEEISILPLSLVNMDKIEIILGAIMILGGDLVICWRAWVLFPHDKIWRFVLAIIMICNIGLNIADSTFDIKMLNESPPALDTVTLSISVATNMTATSLISWKAWAHYRTAREVSVWRKSHAQKVLFFLMESGAVFLVIQLFSLIGMSLSLSPPLAGKKLTTIFLFADAGQDVWEASAALYPIVIMILIHSDHLPIVETLHLTAQSSTLSVPLSVL